MKSNKSMQEINHQARARFKPSLDKLELILEGMNLLHMNLNLIEEEGLAQSLQIYIESLKKVYKNISETVDKL